MIYMRGQARDYDAWAEATGDDTWKWANALDDFRRHEDHYRLDAGADPQTGHNARFSDLHGHGHELRVEKQRLRWDILDAFADAMVEAGVPRTDDFKRRRQRGRRLFRSDAEEGMAVECRQGVPATDPEPAQPDGTHRRHVDRLLVEKQQTADPAARA